MVEYADRASTPQADAELLGYGALYRLYEAADGWIYLAAPASREWDALVTALRDDIDLGADSRFADEVRRCQHDAALAETLAEVFRAKPAQHWEDRLLSHDVGCVVAHPEPPEAVLQSKEFGEASGLLVNVRHPTFDEHERLTPLVEFSRSETVAEPGCLAGQHTDAILTELGYNAAVISGLRERGVVA
jgi:crotonobetainyl-CoA:carnitine CoA-transferase CaiB-like acyl-CoA transferase